jgi:hypothetical protein
VASRKSVDSCGETVIKHATELLARSPDGKSLKLRCVLRDGVRVTHAAR